MEQDTFQTTFLDKTYNIHYLKTVEDAIKVTGYFQGINGVLGIDTETEPLPQYKTWPKAGLSPHLSKVRLLQVYDGKENCFVFDCKFIERPDILFHTFLNSHRFIAHNALFDLQRFKQWGANDMNIGCTYIAAKLIIHAVAAEDGGLSASLGNMVKEALGVDVTKMLQMSDWTLEDLTREQVEYAGLDPLLCWKLGEALGPRIKSLGMERIYQLCKAAQHPIAEMQLNGVMLDVDTHRELIAKYRTELYTAKKEVLKLTGLESITPVSLGEWLEKNLPPDILEHWPKTEGGDRLSTDAHTFAEWSHLDAIKPFSEFQKLFKITSSFGNNLIQALNPETKRLHSNYMICGARTGRLSCNAPNIQQIPKNEDIRRNFVAKSGCVFVCADFSQIELRIAAEISGDPEMQRAYREGIDLHKLTASRLLHKPMEEITKRERQIGKALGLGLLYGLGHKKFAHYVKKGYGETITSSEAKKAVESFRETYSVFREWQVQQAEESQNTMMAKTVLGKRRKLNELNAYGGGLNMPIQGAAAEVMLRSLVNVYTAIKECPRIKLICCVHDEIILESPDEEGFCESTKAMLNLEMTQAYLQIFPKGITRGLVEVKHGKNWAEAK